MKMIVETFIITLITALIIFSIGAIIDRNACMKALEQLKNVTDSQLEEMEENLADQREAHSKLLSQKKSSETNTGQIVEQLAPFLDHFKYNPKKAQFLGQPIDYIIFEDDQIIFVEVKSGKSRLSPKQRNIKRLVTEGKVTWDEIRVK